MNNDQLLAIPVTINLFVTRFDSIKKYDGGIIRLNVKGWGRGNVSC